MNTHQTAEVESATELEPGLTAPRIGRRFLRDLLSSRASTEQLDAVEMVVSELVTNAVRHAGTAGRIRLDARLRRDGSVCVSVTDGSARLPALRQTGQRGQAGGWGLHLVAQLSRGWGTDLLASGKRVWALISAS